MWYHALPRDEDYYRLLYATSADGIHWDKPDLGLVEYKGSKANNIFLRRGERDHIPSIIHTPWEADPDRRYKMINFDGKAGGYMAAWSRDGIHWTDVSSEPVFAKGGDVSQFVWDPHTKRYVGYVKNGAYVSGMRRRAVGRTESEDFITWTDPHLVLAPDTFDDRWAKGVQRTSFYGLSAFAYESMYLGFLWVFSATDNEGYFDGPIFVELVTSRDGVHWLRAEGDRPPVLPIGTPGEWDEGMVMTATHPLVENGKIQLYYGGFDCSHAAPPPWIGAIGLATLRKDGFASLDAGKDSGTITTKGLRHAAGPLHLNYRAGSGGELRVEVLDLEGNVLPGYGREACAPLAGDNIDQEVRWGSRTKLPATDKPIRLRFVLENAALYSFMAGDSVKIVNEAHGPELAALYTFESGWADSLSDDGRQNLKRNGDLRLDREQVAFGTHALRMTARFSPWQTIEIKGTSQLGTHFTLAVMARSQDNAFARLFSSYDDNGLVNTSELIFDCDPAGKRHPGLRLTCKGIAVTSEPVQFADGEYHHLAVTYDDGLITFYLDGKDVGQRILPGGAPVSLERNLFVGEDAGLGRHEQFRGHLDDILVLGRTLSADEISLLHAKGAEGLFRSH